MLTPEERTRYSRHLMLPQLGEEGQLRLKNASVLVVGAGGLGSPVLLYLAAAGVGRIGIVDDDVVDRSNLHRQILFGSSDEGRLKVEAARDRLSDINPLIDLEVYPFRLTSDNAMEIIERYDIVADGTDNFATRYLVNDACVFVGRPNVYASIFRFDGQVSVFGTEGGPCYRCLFPEPPPPGSVPSCAEGGVLGVLPGIVGTLQANEVIKSITSMGETLAGKLLMVDALTMDMRTLRVPRDPECAVCGDRPTQTSLIDYDLFCSSMGSKAGSEPASGSVGEGTAFGGINPPKTKNMFFSPRIPEVSVKQLHSMQQMEEKFLLLDVRQPEELTIADLGGTLVPMGEIASRLSEVAPDRDARIVVMCRSGARSASVVSWMLQQGYTDVNNLAGGIIAWAREIDPSIAVY